MKKGKWDFSGWATRNNLKCSDGRTIMKDAFKHNDGMTVPLVWNHSHGEPENVLGHALLENRPEGVYTYGYFNDTPAGQDAKQLVLHGDITSLSIYANRLKQDSMRHVLHGEIREVSLVLAGANPGAFIDNVITHGEFNEEDAVIYFSEPLELFHSDEEEEEKEKETDETMKYDEDKMVHSDEEEETVGDVFETLSEKQKTAVYAIIDAALEEAEDYDEDEDYDDYDDDEDEYEEDDDVKHNVFDADEMMEDDYLSHGEEMAIFDDIEHKNFGSLKEATLAHGINDIEWLFPEARNLNTPPDFITRDMGWVKGVMNAVHHTPFSRIKSMFANLTADEARARGYVKGNLKIEQVFGLLKRTTTPQTIYKKQKLDRDDVIDITDFDVVAWIKAEMRMMLEEELARAFLVGDGRDASSDDKINELNIRPIWKDADLYTIKRVVPTGNTESATAKNFIKMAKRRKDYKGSGSPVLYTTEDYVDACLEIEDNNGRVIYDTIEKLATAMRVSKIVTVPVMENLTRTDATSGKTYGLMGIIVNLADYNVGADKGGAVSMFEDFDIDYNAQKYLIETRCSGALVKPYSAIALEKEIPAASQDDTPAAG